MFKKSQAALEFLTTYAWAFLVILIMIGALAYFGILNPSGLLPDRCNFGSEIGCEDFSIVYGITGVDDGEIRIRLKNNVGEAIVIDGATVTTESSTSYDCAIVGFVGTTLNTAALVDVVFNSCDSGAVGFVTGAKGKVSIDIDYHLAKSSATYSHQVSGEVFTTVTT